MKLLLDKGASIQALDKERSTPLHLAATSGYPDIVELLLKEGAAIEAVDVYANTGL